MNEEKDFKVIDKRSSSGASDPTESSQKGEGFVMKEKETPGPDNIDFSTFVFSLATGALINLGLAPDPVTKKAQKDLALAKQNIDLLGLLQDKTKGNLTPEETQLLEGLLSEIRLRYVDVTKNPNPT